uniref:Uncharacterized protein n=1 Tax=Ascaris lumbricoides TaxID=6252 RepID=A0A9J2PYU9_ASCLU
MLDLVCTQRQQSADEEHVQKLRRDHSSKHASHLAEGFWPSSHETALHIPENGYSEMRSCSGTTGGTFRQCASTSNFRLSFENRANSAHQSRHAQSFAVSGASYWKDCHGTNIRNRASDRRAPFCTYDSHKRWDIRSALRRNAQTGTDGEENKQGAAWDDFCTSFRIHSRTSGDRQGARFEQLTEESQLDEEQVPEDPCSTKNREADTEKPSCEDNAALWRREEESGESLRVPSGRDNAVRIPAGRYRTPKRSNGDGWYGGPKEFTRCSWNLSHSASGEKIVFPAKEETWLATPQEAVGSIQESSSEITDILVIAHLEMFEKLMPAPPANITSKRKGIVKKFSKTVASIQSRFVRSNLRGICGISDAQIGAGQAHGGAEESTDFKVFDQAQPAASTYIPKRTEETAGEKRYFEYYNKNSRAFFNNRGGRYLIHFAETANPTALLFNSTVMEKYCTNGNCCQQNEA